MRILAEPDLTKPGRRIRDADTRAVGCGRHAQASAPSPRAASIACLQDARFWHRPLADMGAGAGGIGDQFSGFKTL